MAWPNAGAPTTDRAVTCVLVTAPIETGIDYYRVEVGGQVVENLAPGASHLFDGLTPGTAYAGSVAPRRYTPQPGQLPAVTSSFNASTYNRPEAPTVGATGPDWVDVTFPPLAVWALPGQIYQASLAVAGGGGGSSGWVKPGATLRFTANLG